MREPRTAKSTGVSPTTSTARRRHLIAPMLVTGLMLGTGLAGCGDDKKASDSTDTTKKGGKATDVLSEALQAHVDGELDKAADLYRRVLTLDENNKFAHYNLGLISQTKGETAKAIDKYGLVLDLDPKYAPALFNLGILRADAGDTEEAISLYERAIKADGTLASAHFNLGLLLRRTGDDKRGNTEIARAIELDPSLSGEIPPPSLPSSTTTP